MTEDVISRLCFSPYLTNMITYGSQKGYVTKTPAIFYIQSMVFTLHVLVLSVVTVKPLSGHRGADQMRMRY